MESCPNTSTVATQLDQGLCRPGSPTVGLLLARSSGERASNVNFHRRVWSSSWRHQRKLRRSEQHMAHEGPAHMLLAVLCWQVHKGHHLHAEIRAVRTKVIIRVHPAPVSGAACSHDHEGFIAGSFMLPEVPGQSLARCAPAPARESAWLSARRPRGFRAQRADATLRLAEGGLLAPYRPQTRRSLNR